MKVKYLLIAILAVSVFSMAARSRMTANDLLGTWKYTVSNVPPEYEAGFMTFEEKENKVVGYLGQETKQEMKDLTVEGGKISFKLDLQGSEITINLIHEEGKLNGKVVTQDGEFPIAAEKDFKK